MMLGFHNQSINRVVMEMKTIEKVAKRDDTKDKHKFANTMMKLGTPETIALHVAQFVDPRKGNNRFDSFIATSGGSSKAERTDELKCVDQLSEPKTLFLPSLTCGWHAAAVQAAIDFKGIASAEVEKGNRLNVEKWKRNSHVRLSCRVQVHLRFIRWHKRRRTDLPTT